MGKDLATRVQANAEAAKNSPAAPPSRAARLRQRVTSMSPEIARALPAHMDAKRVVRIVLTAINTTPKLGECDPDSVLGAIMTCAQLGLEPGPLGEAYFVPFKDKRGVYQCTFIPGYRGLIKLAWQSNQLKNIDAHIVYDDDQFEYEYGLNPILRHKPGRSRGAITDIYAVASFLNGGSAFVVMSVEEIEEIRARSRASKNGPWVTDWNAMAKKTAVRQLAKWLPMSPELRGFATAAELDESVRTDTDTAVDEVVPMFIDAEPADEQPVEQGLREDDPDLNPNGAVNDPELFEDGSAT